MQPYEHDPRFSDLERKRKKKTQIYIILHALLSLPKNVTSNRMAVHVCITSDLNRRRNVDNLKNTVQYKHTLKRTERPGEFPC